MKFLCVSCDEAMAMERGGAPDDAGSITALFTCPKCGNQIAMLTNAHETEVVTSLGVKLGPDGEKASGGCPFPGMLESEPLSDSDIHWTDAALQRLQSIPEFVRPMARQGIEHYARENGYAEIDEKVLGEARGRFGM